MVVTVDRLRAVYELDDKPAAAGFKRIQEAANRANTELARGSSEAARAVKEMGNEGARLKARFDPAWASAQRFQGAVKDLDRLFKSGGIGMKEYRQSLEELSGAYLRNTSAFHGIDEGARKFGGGLQNVSWQITDLVTQLNSGTAASIAFGQQIPQILGGFGAIGAAAGAGAAILIPLGVNLVRTAFDTQTLDDRMKDLTESTKAMTSASEAASTPLEVLRMRYGALADEMDRVNGQAALWTAHIAQRDLLSTTQSLTRQVFNYRPMEDAPLKGDGSVNLDRQQMALRSYEKQMDRLRKSTGASEDQMDRFVMALNRLSSSNSIEAAAQDLDNMLTILGELSRNTEADQDVVQGWAQTIISVFNVARQQLEAQKRQRQDIVDTYASHTQQLVNQTEQLAIAEQERDKAQRANKPEEVRMWDQIIEKIREAITETRTLIQENDVAFQRMKAAYEQYAETRRQADFDQNDPAGYNNRRAQAYQQYGATRRAGPSAAEQIDLAVAREMIAKFEGGYVAIPYHDVNKYRAGYGSETYTTADGSIHNVVKGIAVSLEDANRDLDRRLRIYFDEQRKYAGSNWDMFTPEQKAALASIQHNYGNIPSRIRPALESGDAQAIATAIAGLAMDYTKTEPRDGSPINYNRRMQEAATFGDTSFQQGVNSAELAALREQTNERKRQLEQIERYAEQLDRNLVTEQQRLQLEQQRNATVLAAESDRSLSENERARVIAEANAEMERSLTIFALLEEAKRRQVNVDDRMVNSTITYRQAIEALADAQRDRAMADFEAKAASEELSAAQEWSNQQWETFRQGLLDAILAGESFTDVLANLAGALARASLEAALFNTGPFGQDGGGGGLFGMLVGAVLGKKASGGPVEANRPYLVGEQGPEVMVPNTHGTIVPNSMLRGGSGSGTIANININLTGANGDQAIYDIARASVLQGLREYDSTLPGRVKQIRQDPRMRNR